MQAWASLDHVIALVGCVFAEHVDIIAFALHCHCLTSLLSVDASVWLLSSWWTHDSPPSTSVLSLMCCCPCWCSPPDTLPCLWRGARRWSSVALPVWLIVKCQQTHCLKWVDSFFGQNILSLNLQAENPFFRGIFWVWTFLFLKRAKTLGCSVTEIEFRNTRIITFSIALYTLTVFSVPMLASHAGNICPRLIQS